MTQSGIKSILVKHLRTRDCISEGEIICSKETMHTLLKEKTVTNEWWSLTSDERDIVADYAIRNWLFYTIRYVRSGKTDCEGGEGNWGHAVCLHNAIIRYLRFGEGEKHYDEISSCYWSRDKTEEHCYWEESFDLPVFPVAITDAGFGHGICAMQIQENVEDFDSWRFFQYSNANIKLGDWQMPCFVYYQDEKKTIHITIDEPTTLCCHGYNSTNIAKWKIDPETCQPEPESTTPS